MIGKDFFKHQKQQKEKKKKESPGLLLNKEGEKIVHAADYAKNYEWQLILTRGEENKLKQSMNRLKDTQTRQRNNRIYDRIVQVFA